MGTMSSAASHRTGEAGRMSFNIEGDPPLGCCAGLRIQNRQTRLAAAQAFSAKPAAAPTPVSLATATHPSSSPGTELRIEEFPVALFKSKMDNIFSNRVCFEMPFSAFLI